MTNVDAAPAQQHETSIAIKALAFLKLGADESFRNRRKRA